MSPKCPRPEASEPGALLQPVCAAVWTETAPHPQGLRVCSVRAQALLSPSSLMHCWLCMPQHFILGNDNEISSATTIPAIVHGEAYCLQGGMPGTWLSLAPSLFPALLRGDIYNTALSGVYAVPTSVLTVSRVFIHYVFSRPP